MKNLLSSDKKGAEGSSLRILTPPLRLTLFTTIFLTIAGIIWTFYAKIPLQTRGTAIFLPSFGVTAVYAQTSGTLIVYNPKKTQPKWVSLAESFLENSNSVKSESVLEVANAILISNTNEDYLYDKSIVNDINNSFKIEKGFLIARVIDPVLVTAISTSLKDYIITKDLNFRKATKLKNQVATFGFELTAQSEYLKGMQSLRAKQFVSQATILQQQATIANLRNQINSVQAQILQTSQDTSSKFIALNSSVVEYIARAMYFSSNPAVIDTLITQSSNFVQVGDQIAIISVKGVRRPSEIPVVFSNRDAASVQQGQKVFLQLISQDSPNSNIRLVGTIKLMSTYPSDTQSLKNVVASQPIANLLLSQYVSPTSGIITLDKDKNGNYVTNIPTDVSFQKGLQPQDSFQALVTTSYVRPIELVLPSFQRFLGIRPIEPKPETSSTPN